MNMKNNCYEVINHIEEEDRVQSVSSDFFLPYNPNDIDECHVYNGSVDLIMSDTTYTCKRMYDGTLRAILSFNTSTLLTVDIDALYQRGGLRFCRS